MESAMSRSLTAKIAIGFLVCLSFAGVVRADQLIKNKDGSSVLRKSDGTKVVTNADGSSVTTKANGTEIIKNADGSSVETDPDGTKVVTNADESSIVTKRTARRS
jgi:hypothetical protein